MEVTLIDKMGSDLSVVNAARVSFAKKSAWSHRLGKDKPVGASYPLVLEEKDKKLINYLAKHNHWTPFGHTAITLHIKAPIFVARQLGKHQVGLVWNEVSRRYVTDEPEFYVPEVWRKAAENVKQGSSKEQLVIDGVRVCRYCNSKLEFLRKEDEKMKVFCSSSCQGSFYRKHTDKGWATTKHSRLRQSAEKRGIPFDLTVEDLLELGRPKYCKYLELELDYSADHLQSNSPSVNRVDSSLGYVKGNLEIISNKANSMLLNATKEELKTFVKNVAVTQFGVFTESSSSVEKFYEEAKSLYNKLVEGGLCAEQARMFMPQSQYCEWYWTGNLYSFYNVWKLRTDSHTQKETQEIAKQIGDILASLYPVSWEALTSG
jgi:thymidylate synthase ThyX